MVLRQPDVTRIDLDESHENCQKLIERAAMISAAIAIEPLPWLDTLAILPLQIKLVNDIGKLYGFSLSRERAKALALELGGAFAYAYASRQFVRGVAKITAPIVGGLLTAPLVFASTFTLGNLAESYFRNQRQDLQPLTDDAKRKWAERLMEEGKRVYSGLSRQDLHRLLTELGPKLLRGAKITWRTGGRK